MKAFVTGATGLLGINLIRLLKSKGYQVKALIRSKDKAQKWLGDLDLELIQGDMTRVGDFAPALAGCDVLFHTAAYFNDYYQGNPKSHWEKLKAVNIEGTRSLLEAAEAQQIKKFIYVSSSGTIGQAETNVADESTGADEQVKANLYFKSKVETDQMIETFLQSHSLAVTSLLPGWMFGPFDTVPSAAGRLILDFSQSKLPAQFEGSVMIVDVRDAANALFEAVGLGESGARYLVAGHFVKLTELLELLTKVT
ncbi:MAG: NAD-dependent epimerase/dehydratase family protein, partial [Trueperaceae bacterium]|nr:NAD-dependent epimerase/dehydratase family protein [Trueperaceae bacterium]